MTASIPVFETTCQKSHEWVNQVAGELHTDERQLAYRVLRGVLHTLRDRLTADEAVHLGAQLPMLLRGMYYEGWSPSDTPTRDDRAEFLQHIQEALADQPGVPDPERWARCVFTVLSWRIDAGEVQDVVGILPRSLVDLWPESVRL
jgi:uncharacterized protein (DUF2267 family)